MQIHTMLRRLAFLILIIMIRMRHNNNELLAGPLADATGSHMTLSHKAPIARVLQWNGHDSVHV